MALTTADGPYIERRSPVARSWKQRSLRDACSGPVVQDVPGAAERLLSIDDPLCVARADKMAEDGSPAFFQRTLGHEAGHSFAYVHKLEHRPAYRMMNFLVREVRNPVNRLRSCRPRPLVLLRGRK